MIVRLMVGQLQANCYLVGCKGTGEAAVIDPGGDVPRITAEITKKGWKVRCILNTHCHWDHTSGNEELKKIVKAPLMIHPDDVAGLGEKADVELSEGQVIEVGTYRLTVIHTPGHTPGGVCFQSPGAVFTGDTLFAGSIGRTDLPGGSYKALIEGVRKKLFVLDDDVRVYPGHGPPTTIGAEKRQNPFFRRS